MKVQFEVSVRQVTDLAPELNGRTVYIIWQRGSREVSGSTKHVLVSQNTASWEEKLIFDVVFVKQNDTIPSKLLDIKLKDVCNAAVVVCV